MVDVPAGLLLAAGGGSRLGLPKSLLRIHGRSLVEAGLAVLRGAGCDPCAVVLGAAADKVRSAVDLSGAHVVQSADWHRGQSHSLRDGLEWASAVAASAVVITLVDQPAVTVAAVERVMAAWREGGLAVTATYRGHPRTPVVLDAREWPSVLASLEGDRGAGPWMRAHPERVVRVEVGDVADARDIDTPEDLAALQGIWAEDPACACPHPEPG